MVLYPYTCVQLGWITIQTNTGNPDIGTFVIIRNDNACAFGHLRTRFRALDYGCTFDVRSAACVVFLSVSVRFLAAWRQKHTFRCGFRPIAVFILYGFRRRFDEQEMRILFYACHVTTYLNDYELSAVTSTRFPRPIRCTTRYETFSRHPYSTKLNNRPP